MAFVIRKASRPGDPLDSEHASGPVAPGAVRSPQTPGEVPDRSSVPDRGVLPVPPATGETRRPRTEYGSAQRIMGVYVPVPGKEDDPARFEQTTVSYEELRKANPSLRTPVRPSAGYALADGTRIANPELASLSEGADSTGVDQ